MNNFSDQILQNQAQPQPQNTYKPTNQKGQFFQNIMSNFSNFFGNVGNPSGQQAGTGFSKGIDTQLLKQFPDFDFQHALNSGYSTEDINEFLRSNLVDPKLLQAFPDFDVQGALEAGYSASEINEYLQENAPESSMLDQGARIGTQFGLGLAENALLPYELGVAPLASEDAQQVPYRENIGEDIENLLLQKESGVWSDEDQKLLDNLMEQIQDTSKSDDYIKTADIGVRGLAEGATGLDLHPEGVLEKAANWAGFIKNPKKLTDLARSGISKFDLAKAIAPTGKEALRGLGAGVALQMAEDGEYGPIGTMAAAVVGDIAGSKGASLAKNPSGLIKEPKKALANAVASFTKNEKKQLQKEIIKDFRDAGIQADLGTITDNNLVKWTQSRLAQSGLTGKKLSEFKDELTGQIKNEYKVLAESLGEARYATTHEAGEVAKEGIKKIRESDLAATRSLYKTADQLLKPNSYANTNRLASAIKKLEADLIPGSIKSGEQQSVLNTLEKLKQNVFDSSGKPMFAHVKELMNNKVALNDIINYEVQGGAKQLLKGLVAELDRAIISYGKENPSFAKNYINANKKFSEHAKTFRNKNMNQLLNASDPSQIMNKMNNIQGIRDIGKALTKTPEGNEIFNNLKRLKLDKVIGDNLVDSTTQQAKLGTFSKLLEKGKNREVVREILGPQAFKRLERLQKNAGRLADSAEKFYNASKSGTVIADAAIVGEVLYGLHHLLIGNPWRLAQSGLGIVAGRKLSNLLADPVFLRHVEDAMLAGQKESVQAMNTSAKNLSPYFKGSIKPAAMYEFESNDENR